MKFKKIIGTAVAAVSLLAFTGIASAAWEINIYGASAQYTFWTQNGSTYLTNKGCSGINYYTKGTDQAIFTANCPAGAPFGDGGAGFLRIASKASFDGCYAIKGESRSPDCVANPGNCAPGRVTECDNDYHKRKFIDPTSCSGSSCTNTLCYNVTIGASDVPCECITQESHGKTIGYNQTDPYIDLTFYGVDMSGYDVCRPMVVTFAPFVNTGVTKGGGTITNITRDNMELIFSGQVRNWGDIADVDGLPFTSQHIVACMRHAGSGTHASLDAYLNSALRTNERWPNNPATTYGFLFHGGTGDMMKCINAFPGAIGYADADRKNETSTVRIKLNGVGGSGRPNAGGVWPYPGDQDIANANVKGNYNFYGVQHLYGNASDLCAYLNDCTKIKAPFNAEEELCFTRSGANACDPCGAFPLQRRTSCDLSCYPH